MANPAQWNQWIYQDAARYGVDPEAAHAIATHEGLNGRPGDANTSFGPFQLHVGGALPSGRGRKWAESRAGVDYALRQMARSGASGLRGRRAVSVIASRFERPANVPVEIADAMAHYGQGRSASRGLSGRTAGLSTLARNVSKGRYTTGQIQEQQDRLSQIGSLLGQVNPDVAPIIQQAMSSAYSRMTAAREADTGKMIPIVRQAGGGAVTKGEQRIVNTAKQYLGTPYKWGGSKPGGFDCSGFVQYLYGRAGIQLGRTTYQQIKQGKPVGRKGLKAGDVIFFKQGTDVHHEALYIGNGKFIHAPHTGDVVKISSLNDPYYKQQFAGGRRFV